MKSNLDDIISKFKGAQTALENVDYSQALLVGVNAAKAKMQFRIFNRRMDKNNVSLGPYRGPKNIKASKKTLAKFKGKEAGFFSGKTFTPYQLKRLKKGRQVKEKDLEFAGDLRRGIKVLKENNKRVVCAIPNAFLFLLSGYQEKDLKTVIFALSVEERKILVDNTNAALKQIYDRILNASKPV